MKPIAAITLACLLLAGCGDERSAMRAELDEVSQEVQGLEEALKALMPSMADERLRIKEELTQEYFADRGWRRGEAEHAERQLKENLRRFFETGDKEEFLRANAEQKLAIDRELELTRQSIEALRYGIHTEFTKEVDRRCEELDCFKEFHGLEQRYFEAKARQIVLEATLKKARP